MTLPPENAKERKIPHMQRDREREIEREERQTDIPLNLRTDRTSSLQVHSVHLYRLCNVNGVKDIAAMHVHVLCLPYAPYGAVQAIAPTV